jgi:hypothetical protein
MVVGPFGIGYIVLRGPDLWRLLQALAGVNGARPRTVFTLHEDPSINCDWDFVSPCLSLIGLKRLDAEGVKWHIEGYFDIRASDPGHYWFSSHAVKRLAGTYNVKSRQGKLMKAKIVAGEEDRCPDNISVPDGTLD